MLTLVPLATPPDPSCRCSALSLVIPSQYTSQLWGRMKMTRKRSSMGYRLDLLQINLDVMVHRDFKV